MNNLKVGVQRNYSILIKRIAHRAGRPLRRFRDIHFTCIDAKERFQRIARRYPFLSKEEMLGDDSPLFALACGLRKYLSDPANPPHLNEDSLGPAYKEYIVNLMEHRFDLLGSKVVECSYHSYKGISSRLGKEYDKEMPAIISSKMENVLRGVAEHKGELSEGDSALIHSLHRYEPIDWHRDLKSGYSWAPPVWHMDKQAGRVKGADIKAPGEMSRFNHITPLAMSYIYTPPETSKDFNNTEKRQDVEIILQILDWIVSNPPRLSMAWRSSLVSAIRCTNWLWALSLLKGSPFLTPAIKMICCLSLLEHADHIMQNLGRHPGRTGNHYLGHIVGLAHFAFAFPGFHQNNKILILCLQELLNEMRDTVYEDGGNYESSSSYHRFVTEMFFHGTSLILKLSKARMSLLKALVERGRFLLNGVSVTDRSFLNRDEVFPEWYFEKLLKMSLLCAHMQGPLGLTPIVGDNDNGRFVKFGFLPNDFDPDYFLDEEFRDHRHILAMAGRLFNQENLSNLGHKHFVDAIALFPHACPSGCADKVAERLGVYPVPSIGTYTSLTSPTEEVKSVVFPDFGVAVLKNQRIWLLVTCGKAGRNGRGGHGHNDILSFELYVDGRPVVVDPGCFNYTSDVHLRNLFRSSSYHNTLWEEGKEQHNLTPGQKGVFVLREKAYSCIDSVGPNFFSGHHSGYGGVHMRRFTIESQDLQIEDWYEDSNSKGNLSLIFAPGINVISDAKSFFIEYDGLALAKLSTVGGTPNVSKAHYSKKYGAIQETTRLVIQRKEKYSMITFRL